MGRRLLTPFGGVLIFLLIVGLVAGGLAWVTVAALKVEAAEREATARADAITKANLALWQLDSRLFPTLATETGRPYAQYFTLYMPHTVALDDAGNPKDPGRVPSPLLSADFPDWMMLHFQLDPEFGWQSPQVFPRETALKLEDQFADELDLNLTASRKQLLDELQNKFDVKVLHRNWVELEVNNPSEGSFGVPIPNEPSLPNSPIVAPPQPGGNAMPPAVSLTNGNLPAPAKMQAPSEYQTANDNYRRKTDPELMKREGTFSRAAKDAQGTATPQNGLRGNSMTNSEKLNESGNTGLGRGVAPPGGNIAGFAGGGGPAGGGGSPPKPTAPAPASKMEIVPETNPAKQVDAKESSTRLTAEKTKPTPNSEPVDAPQPSDVFDRMLRNKVVPLSPAPNVQVGPIRPRWLQAEDGSVYLILVRVARLQAKTVFQGVVLDWNRLRELLIEEIRPTLPQAQLLPVYDGEDTTERRMASIPAKLDPGPMPEPLPVGWSPLRLGLTLGWAAALIALLGIGFGGRALIDLSERRIRFVSAVTHELRTPLTSMRLYLDLLTSGMIEDEEKQKEYLRTLHGESDRLNRLIENVLDFAKLEKRTVQTHIAPIPVDSLLDQARATWTDRCAADGKELVVIGTVPVDRKITTDARMVGQILSNLIDNARKYSPASNDTRIWVWAKPGEGKRLYLEVEDRGPGVELAERASIFRPFRRGQSADTTAGGAGLGLALAKQWAEMLGGRLSYRVADGGIGACFRLELPGG